jgi:hypothetical protein
MSKTCIIQLEFHGEQAEAMRREDLGPNRSAFCRKAIATAFSAATGEDFPSAPERTSGVAGSRLPEARALSLSTSEYLRRVRVLGKAGVEVTPDAVAGVPPLPKREKSA